MISTEIKKVYNDSNNTFSMENYTISALNIVFERFYRNIPLHSHSSNSYEIHYIAYGKGLAIINGVEYELAPNTLYITGPHIEHSFITSKEDPTAEYCVYLKIEEKQNSKNVRQSKHHLVNDFMEKSFWYGEDKHGIHSLMQSLFSELENHDIGYRIQIATILQQIIVAIVRNYSSAQKDTSTETNILSDNQYLIIEECFLYEYNTLTLTDLSNRLGLSPRQTERLLKKHYNQTFLTKKTEAKMSAAILLLRDKNKSITDIADELGYSSIEHFSGAFKRFYHISPREYRKSVVTIHS